MRYFRLVAVVPIVSVWLAVFAWGLDDSPVPVSSQTRACLMCHTVATPGIVADWETSRHAGTSLERAFEQNALARRVSLEVLPDGDARSNAVGCYECHGVNTQDHADSFDHYGRTVNVVVSPADCATCHPREVSEYAPSKKANAHANLRRNPVYSTLVDSIIGLKDPAGAGLSVHAPSSSTEGETCYACHGTEVVVRGTLRVESRFGPLEVPRLAGWPNQGVGRINPDGSLGSCTACHPRHSMSIEIARKPSTCGQCHLEPDVPAYNVYKESKHGNIYESKKRDWNWGPVPWTVGKDFTAPTCAGCHNSLIVDPQFEVVAQRSHDFGARLWKRIFGLIYSHPQPKSGQTFTIVNSDGQPLPTTFDGKPAAPHLIDGKEQAVRKQAMTRVCSSCHSTSWIDGHFDKFDKTLGETDRMVATATAMVKKAWSMGLADAENPFDETIEKLWTRQWLFYANSVRYGSAMMGPDYMAFKNGWWALSRNLNDMASFIELRSDR